MPTKTSRPRKPAKRKAPTAKARTTKAPVHKSPISALAPAASAPATESPPTLRPRRLSRGQTVALVAPSFSFDAQLMEAGRAHLESRYGLKTASLATVRNQDAYFAGTDQRRLDELVHWLTSPDANALIAIRGGYGCAHLYPELIRILRSARRPPKPKIVLGYSDLTILLNGLYQDLGWVTFHGPVLVGRPFRAPLPIEETTLRKSLLTAEPLGAITDPQMTTLVPGKAAAPLVGGCLSLLVSSLGTSYEIRTAGKLLFIEDVDEKPYRIDRMLTQLLHAGKLDEIKGLVVGQMVNCEPGDNSRDPTRTSSRGAIELAVLEHLRKRGIPAVLGFPAGHGMPQITFPIGAMVELRAPEAASDTPAEVVFLEPGVG